MKRKLLFIVCAFLSIIADSLYVYRLYENHKLSYVEVCVASHNIGQRTCITDEDLKIIELPKDFVSNDVYYNVDEIKNQYVKLGYSIPTGSLIYKSALEENISDLANTLLYENELNYDVYVSEVKMNTANLSKNMTIDLYLTVNDNKKVLSDLLLSNVRVTGLYDSNNKPIKDYDLDSKVYIVSLAIDKNYVSILNKAKVLGELSSVISYDTYKNYKTCVLNNESVFNDYLMIE